MQPLCRNHGPECTGGGSLDTGPSASLTRSAPSVSSNHAVPRTTASVFTAAGAIGAYRSTRALTTTAVRSIARSSASRSPIADLRTLAGVTDSIPARTSAMLDRRASPLAGDARSTSLSADRSPGFDA